MNLDDLADLIEPHLTKDAKQHGVWFSRMDFPPRLMLPDDGLAIGNAVEFIGEFLEKSLGLPNLLNLPLLRDIKDIALSRLDIALENGFTDATVFIGLKLNGPPHKLGHIPGLGDITLTAPELTIGRLGAGDHQLSLSGTLTLFNAPFAIALEWPDNSFSGSYTGAPLSLHDLLADAAIDLGDFDCKLTKIDVSVNLSQRSYMLELGLSELGFKTEGAAFSGSLLNLSDNAGKMAGSLKTTLNLAGGKYSFDLAGAWGVGGVQLEGAFHPPTPVPLGQIGADVLSALTAGKVKFTPPKVLDAVKVVSVDAAIDTGQNTLEFICNGAFEEDGVRCRIGFSFKRNADGSTEPGGYFQIGSNRFDLHLHKDATGKGTTDNHTAHLDILAASYSPKPARKFHLKEDLLNHIMQPNALTAMIPSISVQVDGAVFARIKDTAQTDATPTKIIGMALGGAAEIDLTALPLIGKAMDALGVENGMGVSDLQVMIASTPVTHPTIKTLNATLRSGAKGADGRKPFQIALRETGDENAQTAKAGLQKGFNFLGEINIQGDARPLSISAKSSPDKPEPHPPAEADADANARVNPSNATSPIQAPTKDAHWFSIQKTLGPLYLDKIGVTYQNGELWVMPAADLGMAGLTVSLEGFAVSSPLDHFKPTFHLNGLGIDYRKPPIEIGGAFMRVEVQEEDGSKHEEYYGSAVLKAETFALSAMGGYTRHNGDPSMFLYIDLDYPLGGPPFFFVTGLAAGFGYNRDLIIPPIDKLESFPFIQSALGHPVAGAQDEPKEPGENIAAVKSSLSAQIDGMRAYIPPHSGQQWFAAGVHFTSFEIVTGFALLSMSFGHRTELHLLGAATYSYPPDPSGESQPLTRIDVLVDAAYLPDEGTLQVDAKIANGSYVFEPACQLEGGLSFKSWFKGTHKDDFVLTIGGYHPKFKVPAHYPTCQRLAFNWRKSDELAIKGELYFAMTGNYLMAGGGLKATWESGALKAWLTFDADFLIRYKPFHYDASMSISIGAEVTIHFFGTFHLSVHLGADLQIWGPPFAGRVSFDIWIASFSVSFGPGRTAPPALSWPEFRIAFLPADKPLIGVTVQKGLVRELNRYKMSDAFDVHPTNSDNDHHWLINPQHFALQIKPLVPSNLNGHVGVAPMKLHKHAFQSTLEVQIWHKDGPIPEAGDFKHDKVLGKVPSGLWGNTYSLDLNNPRSVDDAEQALTLTARHNPTHGNKHKINRDRLLFSTEALPDSFFWAKGNTMASDDWHSLGASWANGLDKAEFDAAPADDTARGQILDVFFGTDKTKHPKARNNATDLLIKSTTGGITT